MDQLIRRTRMAERQVARRLKVAANQRYDREFKAKRTQERGQRAKEAHDARKQAIRARHEDWEMGPLAPRRDLPVKEDDAESDGIAWGSISASRLRLSTKQTEKELEASAAWAGGLKHLCLAPGDRVVVMEGHFKGKIGEVEKIDKDTAGVILKDVGKVSLGFQLRCMDSSRASTRG
jgi:large subunit ribosomal protein L24